MTFLTPVKRLILLSFFTPVEVFGSENDASFIRTGLQACNRAKYKKSNAEIQKEIKRITKHYALRFEIHKLVI